MRRFIAGALVPVFIFASVFLPYQVVHAGFPLAIPVVVEAAAELGAGIALRNAAKVAIQTVGIAANDASWVAASQSSGLGAALAFIGLGVYSPDAGQEAYVVQVNPDVLLPTPITLTGNEGTFDNPLPWNHPGILVDFSEFCVFYNSYGVVSRPPHQFLTFGQWVSACNDFLAGKGSPTRWSAKQAYPTGSTHPDNKYWLKQGKYARPGCMESSTNDPGWCTGQQAANDNYAKFGEPKDKVRRIRFPDDDSSVWEPDTTDPDWGSNPPQFSSESLQFSGKNSKGEDVKIVLQRSPEGGTRIQSAALSGPKIAAKSLSLSPTGEFESVGETLQPGTSLDNVAYPLGGTSSDPSTGGQTIQFPDDYARTGEAMQAANALKPGVEQLHRDLTDKTDLSDPWFPGLPDFNEVWFKDVFDSLFAWQLPGHSSQCPTSSFSVDLGQWKQNYSFSTHCDLLNDHKAPLSAAMVIVWVITGMFIVLKA